MSSRSSQPSTSGLGRQFSSPKRPRDKRKTQTIVSIPGQPELHEKYLAQLKDLLENKRPVEKTPSLADIPSNQDISTEHENNTSLQAPPDDFEVIDFTVESNADEPQLVEPPAKKRRTQPDISTDRAYARWKTVLPQLVAQYLRYHARTLGKRLEGIPQALSLCTRDACAQKSSRILCLFFDRKSIKNINTVFPI